MCEKYNGYTNYQTWNVALWIDNDEGLSNMVLEQAMELIDDTNCEKDNAAYLLENWLEELIEGEEMNPLAESASMYSDLLGHALANVNWRELADNYIEQAQDNVNSDS